MTWEGLVAAGLIRAEVPLDALTTYRMGGPARWYAEVGDEAELEVIAAELRRSPCEALVLGRGSNLVIGEEGFDGLVIRLVGSYQEIVIEGTRVEAGAAVPLPLLARSTVDAGLGGLEFFVGIPGSVGGAVRQNAGCHGSETKDFLEGVDILDLSRGSAVRRDAADLNLGYRRSALTDTDLVLRARFGLRSSSVSEGEQKMREITRWRRANQPGGTLNAGSVFKNPPGDSAGRIIDQLGLKGFRIGGASVSEKHANFFIAEREATPSDILELVTEVQARVAARTGIRLEPEIRFVGRFRREAS